MPLYKDTAISLDTVKVLNDWVQIVNQVTDADYAKLPAGSNEREMAFLKKQVLKTILEAGSLDALLGKSPTTVDLSRKIDVQSEPVGGKVKRGKATIPQEWQTCLCYLYAAGFNQVVPNVSDKKDVQSLAQLAGRSQMDRKAAAALKAILEGSNVLFSSGNDPERANDREARLRAGVVKLGNSVYGPIPNFAGTSEPVYAPLPDLTDEAALFEYIVAQGKALSDAAGGSATDIANFFESPTEDTIQGQWEVDALRYLNDRLYQEGDRMGAVTVNGKEYLPYNIETLADQAFKCSAEGLTANYPRGYDLFPEARDVMAMASYLAEVARGAAGWEPAIKELGHRVKTTERLAILANEMRSFGCKTINELKSTREVIDEAFRDAKDKYWAEGLSQFEDYIADEIQAQKDNKDQQLTMKEFCERLKAAAESIAASETGKEDPVTKEEVFKDVILGKRQLADVEKGAADPSPEKDPEQERPEAKREAAHGR